MARKLLAAGAESVIGAAILPGAIQMLLPGFGA